jgi:hypothetical protein
MTSMVALSGPAWWEITPHGRQVLRDSEEDVL